MSQRVFWVVLSVMFLLGFIVGYRVSGLPRLQIDIQ
jgi:hypothetical protein